MFGNRHPAHVPFERCIHAGAIALILALSMAACADNAPADNEPTDSDTAISEPTVLDGGAVTTVDSDAATAVQSDTAGDTAEPMDEDRAQEPVYYHFGDGPPADPPWIDERRENQIREADGWAVDHNFGFTDRVLESGITFEQHPVPEGAKGFRPNHYDHGNGIAVADVDGDGLLDIYFVNQVGSNELWRNLGQGRFENITERAGVGNADSIGVSAAFADVDNDGDPDLFTTSVVGGNRLFLNDGQGVFTDVTEASGLAYSGHSSGPTFFDYDRDGLLDLFVANVGLYTSGIVLPAPIDPNDPSLSDDDTYTYVEGRYDAFSAHIDPNNAERSLLYRNLGQGRFQDVTDAMGLVETGWNGDAAPIDGNGDGWPDLYITDMQGDDDYWVNIGGERFEKAVGDPFPMTPWGAMSVKAFDWDNDGLLDLYVTDMHSDMPENITIVDEKKKARGEIYPRAILQTDGTSIFGNAFFHGRPDGSFDEISDAVGAENYWPWGLSIGDLNADGFEDAFIASSMNYMFRYGVNSLLLNESGRMWRDAEFVVGVEPRRDGQFYSRWYTVDCDGVDAGHQDCAEFGPGVITRWHPLGSRSSVIFDIEGDGDLDIVTGEYASTPQVLISDLAQRGTPNFLEIELKGTTSNRDGLGARVVVVAGGRELLRVHDGKSGYLSQSDIPLYIGLGEAEYADSIRVTWPSGTEQIVDGPISAGERLEIVEP